MLENVAVLSRKLVLATQDEVDHLERAIGFPLPPGYREYVSQLGEGFFCGELEVWLPGAVLGRLEEERKARQFYIDGQDQPIGQADIDRCVHLASNLNGDSIIICPDHPGKMFALIGRCFPIQVIATGFTDPGAVPKACFEGQWEPAFEYFEQYHDHPERKWLGFRFATSCPPDAFADFFKKHYSGTRTHWERVGEGPGSYILLLVEALTARIHILTWENDPDAITLDVNLDEDCTQKLDSFLDMACKELAMVRREQHGPD
jgi:hypothetical protein